VKDIKIINIQDPSNEKDSVNKKYVKVAIRTLVTCG
jgi:hypothetical protein